MKGCKTPLQYWLSDGVAWPDLQKISIKLFTMATSSAASERNFSTMGLVHTQMRNSLAPQTVQMLVYVKSKTLHLQIAFMCLIWTVHAHALSEEEGDDEVVEWL